MRLQLLPRLVDLHPGLVQLELVDAHRRAPEVLILVVVAHVPDVLFQLIPEPQIHGRIRPQVHHSFSLLPVLGSVAVQQWVAVVQHHLPVAKRIEAPYFRDKLRIGVVQLPHAVVVECVLPPLQPLVPAHL